MPNKRILCVGLVCVDIVQICESYPKEDSDQRSIDHRWQRGGNASNNCTVLVKCGQECEYFGTLGGDIMAEYIKEDFKKYSIVTENIVTYNKHYCPFSSVITNSKNGSRTIVHSNKGIPEIKLEDFKKLDLEKYHWIHFEGRNVKEVVLMLKYILNWNSQHNPIKISVELEKPRAELQMLLPLADVIFIGKDFALFQGCKNKHETLKRNVISVKPRATVIVAWGEEGAVAQTTESNVVESAAFLSEKVVDTLGAGDTFIGATILCLSKGLDLQQSITTGCRIAGAKVAMVGFDNIHPGLLNEQKT